MITSGLILLLSAGIVAQQGIAAVDFVANPTAVFVGHGPVMPSGFHSNEVVKNAPMSARIRTRSVRELSDGNRIIHEDDTLLHRDSEGRLRREQSPRGSGHQVIISISDPVKNENWILNENDRTARRLPPMGGYFNMPVTAPAVAIRQPTGGTGGQAMGTVYRSEGIAITSSGANYTRSVIGMAPPTPPQISVEPLGQQEMEGIRVEGTSHTTTWPANAFGNERPVVVKKTTWYAPELRMMLKSEEHDPRTGTVTHTSEIISTDEPDASLFSVPDDYQVIEPGTHASPVR